MLDFETPLNTVTHFVKSWRNTPPVRLSQEIISVFNETNRSPDEYKYKLKDGKIVDYLTETEIYIDTSTYLGKKDAELLDALTSWVSENTQGTAIWISPSYESNYPCNKITTYNLEIDTNGEKSTFNMTILFDSLKSRTLEIASKLNPAFSDISDPEVLRNKLIVVDGVFDIGKLFELIDLNNTLSIPKPTDVKIHYFVDLIRSGADARFIAEEMGKEGLIGNHSVSCGSPSSVSSLESNSLTINLAGFEDKFGSLEFVCPRCGATNTRPFGRLVSSCQHCGGDVRC